MVRKLASQNFLYWWNRKESPFNFRPGLTICFHPFCWWLKIGLYPRGTYLMVVGSYPICGWAGNAAAAAWLKHRTLRHMDIPGFAVCGSAVHPLACAPLQIDVSFIHWLYAHMLIQRVRIVWKTHFVFGFARRFLRCISSGRMILLSPLHAAKSLLRIGL